MQIAYYALTFLFAGIVVIVVWYIRQHREKKLRKVNF